MTQIDYQQDLQNRIEMVLQKMDKINKHCKDILYSKMNIAEKEVEMGKWGDIFDDLHAEIESLLVIRDSLF